MLPLVRRVTLAMLGESKSGTGMMHQVRERKNYFGRKAVIERDRRKIFLL